MMLQILLYTLVTNIRTILRIIYFKIIRPEKRWYDIFCAQGINGEPFVSLIDELPQLRRYLDTNRMMTYHEDLAKEYDNVFFIQFRSSSIFSSQ
jgi:hypothetical protein